MNKKIIFLMLVCIIWGASLVSSAPQPPYILYGHVEWNSQMLSGSRLEIKVNGIPETITTDSEGFWQHQILTYFDGTVITLTVLDGCGTGDICSKTVTIGDPGYADYAQVDFSITGELSCPPVSCNCGGGGSGGSCYYSESICNDKYPSEECETKTCPPVVYTQANCNTLFPCEEPIVCDGVTPCPETTDNECENSGLSLLLEGIAALMLLMGGGIQIYKNRKGGITMLHRHKGILGYHDVNRGHRNLLYDHTGLTEDPIQYAKDMKRING